MHEHAHHHHDDSEHAHHHHDDNHTHERYSDRPHPEYVVLDIGEDLGALIVYTDPSLHGSEIEISPDGEDVKRSHKDVLERGGTAHPAFTAVFDKLPEGDYTLWVDGAERERGVRVTGGFVAELDWRTAAQLMSSR
jgi:hypothetical protein